MKFTDLYLSEFHKYILETVITIIQRSLRFTLSPRERTDNRIENVIVAFFFCELKVTLRNCLVFTMTGGGGDIKR